MLAIVLFIIAPVAYAGAVLKPEEAASRIGEQASVCGVVVSSKYAKHTAGQPTFLNLDKPYPQHIFTALIGGSDRPTFSYSPESLLGEEIRVHGAIAEFRGEVEIIVTTPSQITKAENR